MKAVLAPIDDLIPHRPPWSLIDRVVSLAPDEVVAEKLLTFNDPLVGPDGLPGLYLIEALAQTAACSMATSNPGRTGHRGYLVAARSWKFQTPAQVGDSIRFVAKKTSELGSLYGFQGVASVAGREIASGAMTFAVEFDPPTRTP